MKIFLTLLLILTASITFANSKNSKKDLFYTSLKYSYIALNVADLAITFYNLEHGAKEVGPIGKYIINNKPIAITVKAGVVGLSIWALDTTYKDDKKIAYSALIGLNALYSWVLYGNFKVYLQLKR